MNEERNKMYEKKNNKQKRALFFFDEREKENRMFNCYREVCFLNSNWNAIAFAVVVVVAVVDSSVCFVEDDNPVYTHLTNITKKKQRFLFSN